jgi:aspartate racemase
MSQHIGIVGCSAEGASLCYRTICVEGANLLGKYTHPEVTMHTFPLNRYSEYFEVGDWDGVAGLMLSSTEKLANVGADFAICPDNTIHQAFELFIDKSPIPWLHIAEEVIAEAKRRQYKRLAILGTQFLMEGPVYATKLAGTDIEYMIPEPEDRKKISSIIFNELINGVFTAEARDYFNSVTDGLKKQGCDAVVLGCTEIPLLITPETSPLPVLDSTRILARAALAKAVKTNP